MYLDQAYDIAMYGAFGQADTLLTDENIERYRRRPSPVQTLTTPQIDPRAPSPTTTGRIPTGNGVPNGARVPAPTTVPMPVPTPTPSPHGIPLHGNGTGFLPLPPPIAIGPRTEVPLVTDPVGGLPPTVQPWYTTMPVTSWGGGDGGGGGFGPTNGAGPPQPAPTETGLSAMAKIVGLGVGILTLMATG